MSEDRNERITHQKLDSRAGLRSLLIAIDFTAASDRIIGRLTRLPLAEGATITLAHVVPVGLHPGEQHNAELDARKALSDEVRHIAELLPKSIRIRSVIKTGNAAYEITQIAKRQAADLVVMGRSSGRVLRDTFLGSTAERVIRTGKLPVLTVRLAPRTAYRRPAIAVDLDETLPGIFTWLLRILPPPRPPVEVIHALNSPYESLAYSRLPDEAVTARRIQLRQSALRELESTLTTAITKKGVPAKDVPWRFHVQYGSPRTVVTKAIKHGNTDILVLGTHGYSGLAHLFIGSIAGNLLREAGCDVLVVPPGSESA